MAQTDTSGICWGKPNSLGPSLQLFRGIPAIMGNMMITQCILSRFQSFGRINTSWYTHDS